MEQRYKLNVCNNYAGAKLASSAEEKSNRKLTIVNSYKEEQTAEHKNAENKCKESVKKKV